MIQNPATFPPCFRPYKSIWLVKKRSTAELGTTQLPKFVLITTQSEVGLIDIHCQIATLRAQVARREAELESLTLLGLQEEAEAHSTSSVVDLPKLSKKDAQMLRADLHERRRNLDLEVQKLNAEVALISYLAVPELLNSSNLI